MTAMKAVIYNSSRKVNLVAGALANKATSLKKIQYTVSLFSQ